MVRERPLQLLEPLLIQLHCEATAWHQRAGMGWGRGGRRKGEEKVHFTISLPVSASSKVVPTFWYNTAQSSKTSPYSLKLPSSSESQFPPPLLPVSRPPNPLPHEKTCRRMKNKSVLIESFRRRWTKFWNNLILVNKTDWLVLLETNWTFLCYRQVVTVLQTILSNNLRNCSYVDSSYTPPRKFTKFATSHGDRDTSRLSMQKIMFATRKLVFFCLKQYTLVEIGLNANSR